MKPFEFQPMSEEEKILLEERDKFFDNVINVLNKTNDIDRLLIIKEISDLQLLMLFVRAFDTENYEINAFLKPIIEERGMEIPK